MNDVADESQTLFQRRYVCDFCNETIGDVRWSCKECINFDLCNQCHGKSLKGFEQKLIWKGHFPGDPKHDLAPYPLLEESKSKPHDPEIKETFDFILGKLKKSDSAKIKPDEKSPVSIKSENIAKPVERERSWNRRRSFFFLFLFGCFLFVGFQYSKGLKLEKSKPVEETPKQVHQDDPIRTLLKYSNEGRPSNEWKCSNTMQGKHYVTDDRGYLCNRKQISPTELGCCNTINASRYDCTSCSQDTKCCTTFEVCVSCCQQPSSMEEMKEYFRKWNVSEEFYGFEICKVLCRTSSKSIQDKHEYWKKPIHCYDIHNLLSKR